MPRKTIGREAREQLREERRQARVRDRADRIRSRRVDRRGLWHTINEETWGRLFR